MATQALHDLLFKWQKREYALRINAERLSAAQIQQYCINEVQVLDLNNQLPEVPEKHIAALLRRWRERWNEARNRPREFSPREIQTMCADELAAMYGVMREVWT